MEYHKSEEGHPVRGKSQRQGFKANICYKREATQTVFQSELAKAKDI
jgi:hypothetical protein